MKPVEWDKIPWGLVIFLSIFAIVLFYFIFFQSYLTAAIYQGILKCILRTNNLSIKFNRFQFSMLSGHISIHNLVITTASMRVEISRLCISIKYWAKIPIFGEDRDYAEPIPETPNKTSNEKEIELQSVDYSQNEHLDEESELGLIDSIFKRKGRCTISIDGLKLHYFNQSESDIRKIEIVKQLFEDGKSTMEVTKYINQIYPNEEPKPYQLSIFMRILLPMNLKIKVMRFIIGNPNLPSTLVMTSKKVTSLFTMLPREDESHSMKNSITIKLEDFQCRSIPNPNYTNLIPNTLRNLEQRFQQQYSVFFFQRIDVSYIQDAYGCYIRNNDDVRINQVTAEPQSTIKIDLVNSCIEYGTYTDKLRSCLMSYFKPFLYLNSSIYPDSQNRIKMMNISIKFLGETSKINIPFYTNENRTEVLYLDFDKESVINLSIPQYVDSWDENKMEVDCHFHNLIISTSLPSSSSQTNWIIRSNVLYVTFLQLNTENWFDTSVKKCGINFVNTEVKLAPYHIDFLSNLGTDFFAPYPFCIEKNLSYLFQPSNMYVSINIYPSNIKLLTKPKPEFELIDDIDHHQHLEMKSEIVSMKIHMSSIDFNEIDKDLSFKLDLKNSLMTFINPPNCPYQSRRNCYKEIYERQKDKVVNENENDNEFVENDFINIDSIELSGSYKSNTITKDVLLPLVVRIGQIDGLFTVLSIQTLLTLLSNYTSDKKCPNTDKYKSIQNISITDINQSTVSDVNQSNIDNTNQSNIREVNQSNITDLYQSNTNVSENKINNGVFNTQISLQIVKSNVKLPIDSYDTTVFVYLHLCHLYMSFENRFPYSHLIVSIPAISITLHPLNYPSEFYYYEKLGSNNENEDRSDQGIIHIDTLLFSQKTWTIDQPRQARAFSSLNIDINEISGNCAVHQFISLLDLANNLIFLWFSNDDSTPTLDQIYLPTQMRISVRTITLLLDFLLKYGVLKLYIPSGIIIYSDNLITQNSHNTMFINIPTINVHHIVSIEQELKCIFQLTTCFSMIKPTKYPGGDYDSIEQMETMKQLGIDCIFDDLPYIDKLPEIFKEYDISLDEEFGLVNKYQKDPLDHNQFTLPIPDLLFSNDSQFINPDISQLYLHLFQIKRFDSHVVKNIIKPESPANRFCKSIKNSHIVIQKKFACLMEIGFIEVVCLFLKMFSLQPDSHFLSTIARTITSMHASQERILQTTFSVNLPKIDFVLFDQSKNVAIDLSIKTIDFINKSQAVESKFTSLLVNQIMVKMFNKDEEQPVGQFSLPSIQLAQIENDTSIQISKINFEFFSSLSLHTFLNRLFKTQINLEQPFSMVGQKDFEKVVRNEKSFKEHLKWFLRFNYLKTVENSLHQNLFKSNEETTSPPNVKSIKKHKTFYFRNPRHHLKPQETNNSTVSINNNVIYDTPTKPTVYEKDDALIYAYFKSYVDLNITDFVTNYEFYIHQLQEINKTQLENDPQYYEFDHTNDNPEQNQIPQNPDQNSQPNQDANQDINSETKNTSIFKRTLIKLGRIQFSLESNLISIKFNPISMKTNDLDISVNICIRSIKSQLDPSLFNFIQSLSLPQFKKSQTKTEHNKLNKEVFKEKQKNKTFIIHFILSNFSIHFGVIQLGIKSISSLVNISNQQSLIFTLQNLVVNINQYALILFQGIDFNYIQEHHDAFFYVRPIDIKFSIDLLLHPNECLEFNITDTISKTQKEKPNKKDDISTIIQKINEVKESKTGNFIVDWLHENDFLLYVDHIFVQPTFNDKLHASWDFPHLIGGIYPEVNKINLFCYLSSADVMIPGVVQFPVPNIDIRGFYDIHKNVFNVNSKTGNIVIPAKDGTLIHVAEFINTLLQQIPKKPKSIKVAKNKVDVQNHGMKFNFMFVIPEISFLIEEILLRFKITEPSISIQMKKKFIWDINIKSFMFALEQSSLSLNMNVTKLEDQITFKTNDLSLYIKPSIFHQITATHEFISRVRNQINKQKNISLLLKDINKNLQANVIKNAAQLIDLNIAKRAFLSNLMLTKTSKLDIPTIPELQIKFILTNIAANLELPSELNSVVTRNRRFSINKKIDRRKMMLTIPLIQLDFETRKSAKHKKIASAAMFSLEDLSLVFDTTSKEKVNECSNIQCKQVLITCLSFMDRINSDVSINSFTVNLFPNLPRSLNRFLSLFKIIQKEKAVKITQNFEDTKNTKKETKNLQRRRSMNNAKAAKSHFIIVNIVVNETSLRLVTAIPTVIKVPPMELYAQYEKVEDNFETQKIMAMIRLKSFITTIGPEMIDWLHKFVICYGQIQNENLKKKKAHQNLAPVENSTVEVPVYSNVQLDQSKTKIIKVKNKITLDGDAFNSKEMIQLPKKKLTISSKLMINVSLIIDPIQFCINCYHMNDFQNHQVQLLFGFDNLSFHYTTNSNALVARMVNLYVKTKNNDDENDESYKHRLLSFVIPTIDLIGSKETQAMYLPNIFLSVLNDKMEEMITFVQVWIQPLQNIVKTFRKLNTLQTFLKEQEKVVSNHALIEKVKNMQISAEIGEINIQFYYSGKNSKLNLLITPVRLFKQGMSADLSIAQIKIQATGIIKGHVILNEIIIQRHFIEEQPIQLFSNNNTNFNFILSINNSQINLESSDDPILYSKINSMKLFFLFAPPLNQILSITIDSPQIKMVSQAFSRFKSLMKSIIEPIKDAIKQTQIKSSNSPKNLLINSFSLEGFDEVKVVPKLKQKKKIQIDQGKLDFLIDNCMIELYRYYITDKEAVKLNVNGANLCVQLIRNDQLKNQPFINQRLKDLDVIYRNMKFSFKPISLLRLSCDNGQIICERNVLSIPKMLGDLNTKQVKNDVNYDFNTVFKDSVESSLNLSDYDSVRSIILFFISQIQTKIELENSENIEKVDVIKHEEKIKYNFIPNHYQFSPEFKISLGAKIQPNVEWVLARLGIQDEHIIPATLFQYGCVGLQKLLEGLAQAVSQ